MRMLFCKISCMKYYKGHCAADVPLNGGKYVQEHGYGHEEFNFLPRLIEGETEEECLGFVEPKSNRGRRNSFHIENIEGCAALANEPFVEDVLVVWCATRQQKDTTVAFMHRTKSGGMRQPVFKELRLDKLPLDCAEASENQ